MTFLEYVCETFLGPPNCIKDSGETQWECPFCGDEAGKFHTRPVSARYPKQRFACWKCSTWGDEFDLIVRLHPHEDRPAHVRRWKMLREEWAALDPAQPLTPKGCIRIGPLIFSQGCRAQARQPSDQGVLHQAYAEMGGPLKLALKTAMAFAEKYGVDLTDLAQYVRSFDEFIKETDAIERASARLDARLNGAKRAKQAKRGDCGS